MKKNKATPKSDPSSYQDNYTTLADRKVSLYKNFKSTNTTLTLKEFIEQIKDGRYKQQVKNIRKLREAGKDRSKAKGELPAITTLGVFPEKRGKDQPLEPSHLIMLDIDKLEPEELAEAKKAILSDQYTVACFVSPSGNGLKIAINTHIQNDTECKTAYSSLEAYYKNQYNLTLDNACKDLPRLCFVSYDPDVYYNPDATLYEYEKPEPKAATPTNTNATDIPEGFITEKWNECISLMRSATNGHVDNTLNKTAFLLGQLEHTGEVTEDKAREALTSIAIPKGHTNERADITFNQGWEAGVKDPNTNYKKDSASLATATTATRLHEIIKGEVEPEPIIQEIEQRAFPIEELPTMIRNAVEEGVKYIQAPVPMVVASALSMVSVACQGKIDIQRDKDLQGPSTLWFLIIAMSGDRKSTVDNHFSKALRKFEKENRADNKEKEHEYNTLKEAWEAKRSGLLSKIKKQAQDKKPTGEYEEALKELDQKRPNEPVLPRYIYQDTTQEALRIGLKRWPSGINLSSEAGEVLNSHGMKKDNVGATLSFDNKLWSGEAAYQDRASKEGIILETARLSKCWAIQPEAFDSFMEQSGEIARGSGALARFLISRPKSMQGYRPYMERPPYMPYNQVYQDRITSILDTGIEFDSEGNLKPKLMTLSPEAKESWVETYNVFEKALREGGELTEIRDVASKSADNVVRLAALFEYFENNRLEVTDTSLKRAANIIGWYLEEALSFYRNSSMQQEDKRMLKLEKWIINECKKEDVECIPLRKIQQYAPRPRYKKEELLETLTELQSFNRGAVLEKEGKPFYYINLHLLKNCSHVASVAVAKGGI